MVKARSEDTLERRMDLGKQPANKPESIFSLWIRKSGNSDQSTLFAGALLEFT
ncbi:hypothetical protein [Burkholderia vietnamiensis]|uniref:hypothetical protein n=1 Tax=Burkholderia vietnamiensis TaxID=60552 RepID=UPI00158C420A|nr:hypothetical protein [Burkholderia vietnamiensis]